MNVCFRAQSAYAHVPCIGSKQGHGGRSVISRLEEIGNEERFVGMVDCGDGELELV